MKKAIKAPQLDADHAVLFTPSSGDLAGKLFLIVDANRTVGYQVGDVVAELQEATQMESFSVENFTVGG